ncbi:MAG: AMP-binding protein, partial [Hyphomicrobiaceae bacterium]
GQMAAALAGLGVGRGDRGSFLIEKSPQVVVLAHACLRLGAILHPLNTSYTDAEVSGLLGDAEPRVLVVAPQASGRFQAVAGKAGATLATLSEQGAGSLGEAAAARPALTGVAAVAADDVAAILYTSGTTGRPKGAMITHGNLIESARALGQVWKMTAADVLYHALPVYHAHGLLTALNTAMVAGASVLFHPRFEATAAVAALPRASVIMAVPTIYARLLEEPELKVATRNLRLVISGSAPLPLEVGRRFKDATGLTIRERYGSTEAAIITAMPLDVEGGEGSVGMALPGIEVRLRNEDGRRAATGIGVLETRGHNVFRGYWRNADADVAAFPEPGWFDTGDVAEIDGSGLVRLLGRNKDLIISGGLNVYPMEVETVLDTLPGVACSAVFAAPHPDFGEAVVAAVEMRNDTPFDERGIIAAARERLAPYKTPKRVIVTDEIPRNRRGKVEKNKLRDQWRELFTADAGKR